MLKKKSLEAEVCMSQFLEDLLMLKEHILSGKHTRGKSIND